MADYAPNIELSALNGANGFKISGVTDDDQSGFSVAWGATSTATASTT